MNELLMRMKKDNIQAMRDKNKISKGVLSLMISAMALAEKEAGKDLTEEEALKFVQREMKQEKDTLASTPEDRVELIELSKAKIVIIDSYLPKQLSEEEIKTAITEIINEKGLELSRKVQGVVMKEMMAKFAGKTDGKSVNKVLGSMM
jgi:uncharacterized protein YqeY